MPKRKISDSEKDDYEDKSSSSDVEETEAEASKSESSEDDESKYTKKKQKTTTKTSVTKRLRSKDVAFSSKGENDPTTEKLLYKTNTDGEKYIDLGKKKRATVRSFKGIPLLDIREFYGTEGQEKPGKKGISLTLEQWDVLKERMNIIDQLFADQKKGK